MKDFCVIGAGIFGLTTAICLRERGYSVQLINYGTIPDPLAASTDISKIVRMEYGTDDFYMLCADQCIDRWNLWNQKFGQELYHQVGFLLLSSSQMEESSSSYESSSYYHLLKNGFSPERLSGSEIAYRYPMFNHEAFVDGFVHAKGGYAESGLAIEVLYDHAKKIGVETLESTPIVQLKMTEDKIDRAVSKTHEFEAGHFVVAAGPGSKEIVPQLEDKLISTGHPVFHFDPRNKDQFKSDKMPVFAADLARSGFYGFPLHPKSDVVKVANHGVGEVMKTYDGDRIVRAEEEEALQLFVQTKLPGLIGSPIVYRRKCVYTDSRDGHFIIDRHPDIPNLTVATGGSGHGFKMGPLVGEWVSDAAVGKLDRVPKRFRWRDFDQNARNEEQARNLAVR